MYESYLNEYSYPLLPSILSSLENQNVKSFIKVNNKELMIDFFKLILTNFI